MQPLARFRHGRRDSLLRHHGAAAAGRAGARLRARADAARARLVDRGARAARGRRGARLRLRDDPPPARRTPGTADRFLAARPRPSRPISSKAAARRTSPRFRKYLHSDPEKAQALLDWLEQIMTRYLHCQIAAGAQVVQLFDSWGGELNPADWERFCAPGLRRIIDTIDVPVIFFGRPRAARRRRERVRRRLEPEPRRGPQARAGAGQPRSGRSCSTRPRRSRGARAR